MKKCKICNKLLIKYQKKYCSRKCQHKSLKENKNAKGHKFINYHKNIAKMKEVNKGNKYTLGYKHTNKSKQKIKEASKNNWKNKEFRLKTGKKIREGLVKHYQEKNGEIMGNIKSQIRSSFQYNDWRINIFKRDNYSCQHCGKSNCYLEAHHKMQFLAIIKKYDIKTLDGAFKCKKLWDVNNGITLCKDCHNKTKVIHNYVNYGGEPIKVYLSGYMNNKKIKKCLEWREKIKEHYNNWNDGEGYPIIWLDPTNGDLDWGDNGMSSRLVSGRALVMRDFNSVKNSDLIIANLDTFGEKRCMIGTFYELAWAWQFHKPIIIITKDYYKNHPFIKDTASMLVKNVNELLKKKYINWFFKGWVNAKY